MTHRRGESGLTSTGLAVVMPVLMLWIMLIVQYGLWFHAKQVSAAAAAEALDAAQVPAATPADGERAARSFLAQTGNLDDVSVEVDRSVDVVTVRVSGRAPQLVPGAAWGVTSVAEAPVERFVPQPQR
ncbi:MAG: pilus assembly protein [Actinobacteria bacterium]|nr:pilus assembly protein [Actinomycetota bacterium]